MAQSGRPEAITEEDVLNAIRKWKTVSPYELAENLNVSHMTIYRRLEKIPQERIDQIFQQLADSELKPAEIENYTVFEQLPPVQEYKKKLLDKLLVSPHYADVRCRTLWQICRILKRKPESLNVDECSELIAKIRRKEITIKTRHGTEPMGLENAKKTLRSWFQNMMNISGKFLKGEGIDASPSEGTGARAQERLTLTQRHAFMRVLEEKIKQNWELRKGTQKISIPFADEPHLALRMKVLPKAYYYWGNRKVAVLESLIEDIQWDDASSGHPFAVQTLTDKGLHKKGRKVWKKDTTGELLAELKALHEALGKPTQGKWFPFTETQLVAFFIECYKEAGITEKLYKGMPIHIWRHTACQDFLDATHRNWDLVADRLAWESIDTMKKHYGKTSPDDLRRGMLEAMGVKVEWEKREFKF